MARKAPTGVRLSATSSRQTGTTEWFRASSRNERRGRGSPSPWRAGRAPPRPGRDPVSLTGEDRRTGGGNSSSPRCDRRPRPSWSTVTSTASPSQSYAADLHPLAIAGGLPLAPVLLPAPAPKPGAAGCQGAAQGLDDPSRRASRRPGSWRPARSPPRAPCRQSAPLRAARR